MNFTITPQVRFSLFSLFMSGTFLCVCLCSGSFRVWWSICTQRRWWRTVNTDCWSCSISYPETGSKCFVCFSVAVTWEFVPVPVFEAHSHFYIRCFHRLDPILYKKCQGDAARLCYTHKWNETSEQMPAGAVFSCLYRHAYRTEEQGRRVWWRKHTLDSVLEIVRATDRWLTFVFFKF